MIERQFIRQMQLKPLPELNRFARDLELGLSPWNEDVQHFWQLGILRADLVISKEPLEIEGIVLIEKNEFDESLMPT
jgi:hypothetical protein